MKYIFSSLLASRADWNAQAGVENALLAAACVSSSASCEYCRHVCERDRSDVGKKKNPSTLRALTTNCAHVTCIYSESPLGTMASMQTEANLVKISKTFIHGTSIGTSFGPCTSCRLQEVQHLKLLPVLPVDYRK